jgi:hypothetical protein
LAKAETGGSDPAERERRKQAAEEKKRVEQEQEAERRKQLLAQAESAVAAQQEALTNARARSRALAALVSHTEGFYDEIDKLAKGKALFAATDLAVQQVNDIIRDAKAIIEDDLHLNRVKEFVPAGDNPVYPDILLATRAVQQCLSRGAKDVEATEKKCVAALRERRTIVAGVRLWIESDEEPTKDEVASEMDGKPTERWFFESDDGEMYFDVERLAEDGVASANSEE